MKYALLIPLLIPATLSGAPAADGKSELAQLEWRQMSRCGPNCLYVMLAMHGKRHPYDQILSQMELTDHGVNVADLVRTAAHCGLQLSPLQADPQGLRSLPLPGIVHFQAPGTEGHFVLLLRINDDNSCLVLDCTRGKVEEYSQGDFYERWSGVVLVPADAVTNMRLDRYLVWSGSAVLLMSLLLLTRRFRKRRPQPFP
jgi:ABC-type bacteriocin/lantibiotic exporter with double-glycine peptidase domain